MPLNTNLSSSPYFDDFDSDNDYYRILFKPATAVQVRELNQLQTMLQDQIEQFGDHILKAGTILDGCNFNYQTSMPYVKIMDSTKKGAAIELEKYFGLNARGMTNGKVARITHTEAGFESDNINLKTLYLDYEDDDDNVNDVEYFVEGEDLQIYSKDLRLWDLTVTNNDDGAQVYTNNDVVVILSAIEVVPVTNATSTGLPEFPNAFSAADTLTDDTGTIDLILTHDGYAHPENEGSTILRIKPNPAKMYGSNIDVDSWDISVGDILTSSGGNELRITALIGEGATGTITTSTAGQILSADIRTGGSGYEVLPFIGLYSVTAPNASNISDLILDTQNYYQTVSVAAAPVTDPVGFGYGMEVSKGKIYQKGLFLNVDRQFKMVSKFSNTPSDLSVGFDSVEGVVNVFSDSSLYDNAAGFTNFSAPGADRLKMTPTLQVLTDAEEKEASNYFALVRFSEGKPFQQNKTTQYNKLGDMIAERTYEESGNYVLDEFRATTRSPIDFGDSDTTFSYVIDPGHAYIGGYRIKTETNFVQNVDKATAITSKTGEGITVQYGVYINVSELAGVHSFNDGDNISLRDTAVNFISQFGEISQDVQGSNIGTEIGTAKIRGLEHYSGIQGTPNAQYRLYVYDIQMNKGKAFKDVKSIYTNLDSGTITAEDGIADIDLIENNEFVIRTLKSDHDVAVEASNNEYIATSFGVRAEVLERKRDALVVPLQKSVASVSNTEYRYKAISNTYISASLTSGTTKVVIPRIGSDTFPYITELSDREENDVILIPNEDVKATSALYANLQFVSVADSRDNHFTITANTDGGADSATFRDDLKVGDWITDSTTTGYAQIVEIAGQNRLTFRTSANTSLDLWTANATGQELYRIFPEDVPIPLDQRTGMSANTNAAKTELTIDLGDDFGSPASRFTAIFDQVTTAAVSMDVNRGQFVKVNTTDSWAKGKPLGFPGIIRLVKVYNGTTTSAEDITSDFYVDPNQTPGYWGLGYLYKKSSRSQASLATEILVEIDYVSDSGVHGVKTVSSYPLSDDQDLESLRANSAPVMHTLEIPEFFSESGYFDLRDSVDFRPMAAPTANVTTSAAGATTATETLTFNYTTYRFPKPQSDFSYDIGLYSTRIDEIYVKNDGKFEIYVGGREMQQTENKNRLSLYKCVVAPYPSLPEVPSIQLKEIMATNVKSQNKPGVRIPMYTNKMHKIDPQIRSYTMGEIAKLEQRLVALEYNQNMSELENQTKNRAIGSSVDSTIERFKYGFFVDNFENYGKTAGVPYYRASIYEYQLSPMKSNLNIDFKISDVSSKYRIGNKITFPYKRKQLLSQDVATYAKYVEPPVITIEEFCEFETNRNMKYISQSTGVRYETLERVWEEFTFVATDEDDGIERNWELKFYNPAGGIAYEVIQTKNPPTAGQQETGYTAYSPTNSGAIKTLEGDDARNLYSEFYPVKNSSNKIIPFSTNPWFESQTGPTPFAVVTNGVSSGVNYYATKGTGKITGKYDKNNGRYITVRVHKRKPVFNFEFCFPATADSDAIYDSGQSTFSNPPPPCPKGTFKYATCVGTTRRVYVCDGNYGTELGYTQPNHPSCTPSVVIDPPPPGCPSGTVAYSKCEGQSHVTYVYTGQTGSGPGGCSVRKEDVVVCAAQCGCSTDPVDPCAETESTPPSGSTADDGCVVGVDPECNQQTSTPTSTPTPVVDPPAPPQDPPPPPPTKPTPTPPDNTPVIDTGGGKPSLPEIRPELLKLDLFFQMPF